ncbi:hypothetical protein GUITHDRAFT_142133 [Guillardia theta CCMP2712]|uniref:Peptidase S74 domain-containing protein n=1 Tax=Guillardia theta (strain CCMP2712) TaxID=905079 RepID=L1IY49_GUITC|nr:hypothetical protein GUITHDRAFT_142133 [Guillardia theta CCMP2712]EKX41203.1 hypothetical protein GUITHDRAFT_142133 [Guillardia theta CCMP2712]|eukprot:XP_005828183.1 hypothetical protein GUITHDRAFT_142133 [Guillardia theta CCMP2712]
MRPPSLAALLEAFGLRDESGTRGCFDPRHQQLAPDCSDARCSGRTCRQVRNESEEHQEAASTPCESCHGSDDPRHVKSGIHVGRCCGEREECDRGSKLCQMKRSRPDRRRLRYGGSGLRSQRHFLGIQACLFLTLVGEATGWVSLSDQGYIIKNNLLATAGARIEGELRVNGVIISQPVDNIECTKDQMGALRWNDQYFESCNGVDDWQPLRFCDRSCNVNTLAVPCGLPVNNGCGDQCNQVGSGLNMRQCILKVSATPCNVPVFDDCNNTCGIIGQFGCDASEKKYGAVLVKSLEDSTSTAAYEFTVGSPNAVAHKDSLFLTYKNIGGISKALTMIRNIDMSLHGELINGIEFAKPEGQWNATMRVNMLSELRGDYIQVGRDSTNSQVYFDGVIDKECPLILDGGVNDGMYTKLCLETPSQQRSITFPDRTGLVITSGNREDIDQLPGLRGDDTFVYTGRHKDLGNIIPPPPSRFSCSNTTCSNETLDMNFLDCRGLNWNLTTFDAYRVYYLLSDFYSDTIHASTATRDMLASLWKLIQSHNVSTPWNGRNELAKFFIEASVQNADLPSIFTRIANQYSPEHTWKNTFASVTTLERCFVCCCSVLTPAAVNQKVCPARRSRPQFCVGGSRNGEICKSSDECTDGGACVNDPSLTCYEHDFGFRCMDLSQVPNFTTTVNFTEPQRPRTLVIPDASGTIVTTGNLEDITAMGVLSAELKGWSSYESTTALKFERCYDGTCGIQQVSSKLANNTLSVPSFVDGDLLTTGNLDKISFESGNVSSLRVQNDMQVNGLFEFGPDKLKSGVRLPPREPSKHYLYPHGGQRAGYTYDASRGPGQLNVLTSTSTTVLEFEPSSPTLKMDPVSRLVVPFVDGTVLTTGNLEGITKDTGTLTSVFVSGPSYINQGFQVSNDSNRDAAILSVRPRMNETIIFQNPYDYVGSFNGTAFTTREASRTVLKFGTQSQRRSSMQFPDASGRVITTGNLQDIDHFVGQNLNVSGKAFLDGAVVLGSNRSTLVNFVGYLSSDIVVRSAPRFEAAEDQFNDVPKPFTWGIRPRTSCVNDVPGPLMANPFIDFPEYKKYNITGSATLWIDTTDNCLQQCKRSDPTCGLVLASRYYRVQMKDGNGNNLIVTSKSCPISQWYLRSDCQVLRLAQSSSSPSDPLTEFELLPVKCGGIPCWDISLCPLDSKTCDVIVQSHSTRKFLSSGRGTTFCGSATSQFCSGWSDSPSLWNANFNSDKTYYLTRVSTCLELPANTSQLANITCDGPGGDSISSISFVSWGENVDGVCGLYNASTRSCGNATEIEAAFKDLCLGAGCTVALTKDALTLLKIGTARIKSFSRSSCDPAVSRLAVQAKCSVPPTLTVVKDSSLGAVTVDTPGSPVKISLTSYRQGDLLNKISRECLLAYSSATDCWLQKDEQFDVHFYMRNEATRLSFSIPTGTRKIELPEANGTMITSGNLEDINLLLGLRGKNNFIFQHGGQPGDPVTIVDFAALGTAPLTRVDGVLPSYSAPYGMINQVPLGGNRRLVFPDATGTVITTGNTDDLVFKSIELQGLDIQSEVNFGSPGSPTFSYLNLGNTSRISGCFNFLINENDATYTQVCTIPATQPRNITFPDVSGTVLTTGNLLGLPNIRIPNEQLYVGGDVNLQGNISLGSASSYSSLEFFSWVDGDVSMRFSNPDSGPARVQLTVPHLFGVDIALRDYLSTDAPSLPVGVKGKVAFRVPVEGTQQIDQTVCRNVLSSLSISDYHELGYYAIRQGFVARTKMAGLLYARAIIQYNRTLYQCLDVSGRQLCSSYDVDTCTCNGAGQQTSNESVGFVKDVAVNSTSFACNGILGSKDCSTDTPPCLSPLDPFCAYDGNASTFFSLQTSTASGTAVTASSDVFDLTALALPADLQLTVTQCMLGMDFVSPTVISLVRILPRSSFSASLVGAVVQGLNTSNKVWEDVLVVKDVLPEGVWTSFVVSTGHSYDSMRFLGPQLSPAAASLCDLAEVEWHQGKITQLLSPIFSGERSYFVDESKIVADPTAAEAFKCAEQGWYPDKQQDTFLAELVVPDVTGTLITTGNLEDISKESAFSSLAVQQKLLVMGNSSIGQPGSKVELQGFAVGQFPLAFVHKDRTSSTLTLHLPEPSSSAIVHLPDSSGSIVTAGTLPEVFEEVSVLGVTSLDGETRIGGNLLIGDPRTASSVRFNVQFLGSVPLTFSDRSWPDNVLSIGVESPTEDRLLTLPDVSGTVLTTGNMLNVLETTSFIGQASFYKGASFTNDDVIFGTPGAASLLEVNAVLTGSSPLRFPGTSQGASSISLGVEEPSGSHVITLPDVTGTILTTGNFPDVVESLNVIGEANLLGKLVFAGSLITIGSPDRAGKVEVRSVIHGRFPLRFSEGIANVSSGSTVFEISPPTGQNIISFPDVSGTVITTGNLPSSIVFPEEEYVIKCSSLLANATTVSLGVNAAPAAHTGSFVFTDGSVAGDSSLPPFSSKADGSFNVRARGGIKFVTGFTPSGKELGVVLEPRSSSWSVLSDRNSKEDIQQVNPRLVLQKLVKEVPISTWSYQGDDVRHMGPMAQDFFMAFGLGEDPTRISSVDIDGVALASLHGLNAIQEEVKENVKEARRAIELRKQRMTSMDELLLHNEELARRNEELMRSLLGRVQGRR